MKKLILITLAVLFANQLSAQTAVGLRLGSPAGITLKKYQGNMAWDFTLGTAFPQNDDNWGLAFTAYRIKIQPTGWHPQLDWHWGFGAGTGFRTWEKDSKRNEGSDIYASAGFQIGLEFRMTSAPFNFSIDAMPMVEAFPRLLSTHWNGNLGIKYRLQ